MLDINITNFITIFLLTALALTVINVGGRMIGVDIDLEPYTGPGDVDDDMTRRSMGKTRK